MPIDVRQLMGQAWSAIETGDLAKAESLLSRVVASHPKYIPAVVGLGIVDASRGRREAALGRMRTALEVAPDFPPALIWMATLLLQGREFKAAGEFAERAYKADPYHSDTGNILARCYLQQDQFAKALAVANAALRSYPQDASLLYVKGSALKELVYPHEAAEAFRQAVALEPELEGLINLADLELTLGRVQDAIQAAEAAVAMNTGAPEAHIALGRSLLEGGRPEEARTQWEICRTEV